MADIFISYAAADRRVAEQLALRLEAEGWSVWWDREIPAGVAFDLAIERAIRQARCVVVLWSPDSASSDWVRSEASEGRRNGLLVPVLIRTTEVPLEFRRLQTVDLVGWPDIPRHSELERFIIGLRALTASSLASTAKQDGQGVSRGEDLPRASSRLGHPAIETLLSNTYDRWRSGSIDHFAPAAAKHAKKYSQDDFILELNRLWGVLLRAALRGRDVADDEFLVAATPSFVLTSGMLYAFEKEDLAGPIIAVTLRDVASFTLTGWWTKTLHFEMTSGEHIEISGMETAPKKEVIISFLDRPPR